jgi:hypothetical protein
VTWVVREPPLAPVAVAATGAAASRLVAALLRRVSLGGLAGVAGEGVVVVIGEELPWAEGVVYLGRDPDAPGVLLPTRLRPGVPVDLFARAARAKVPEAAWPVAVLASPALLVPVGGARALGRAELERLA